MCLSTGYGDTVRKAGKIDRFCNPFTMLSLDSADMGIWEAGEKTGRVRYVRFAVYFHVRARERANGSPGSEERKSQRWRKTARDRGRQERQHVRLTSVESDETLLDSAPGISRGNEGLILRRKFLTSRTFEPGKGEAFKVLSSRRFPDARGRRRERWRNIEENARARARLISINLFGRNSSLTLPNTSVRGKKGLFVQQ